MFFAFALMTMIGVGGMVITHSEGQLDQLPSVPTSADVLTEAALDQNTTWVLYNITRDVRLLFISSVDTLNYAHADSQLSSPYAKVALANEANNFIIYLIRKRGSEKIICGFAVGKLSVVQGAIYAEIDVVLTERGTGQQTLEPFVKLQFETLRALVSETAPRVLYHLKSFENQVSFYQRNGFTRYPDFDSDGLFFMGMVVEAPSQRAITAWISVSGAVSVSAAAFPSSSAPAFKNSSSTGTTISRTPISSTISSTISTGGNSTTTTSTTGTPISSGNGTTISTGGNSTGGNSTGGNSICVIRLTIRTRAYFYIEV
jgi:hypothetical protein